MDKQSHVSKPLKRKHYIILGITSGIIFGMFGISVFIHPFKFILMTTFYWASIIYVESKVGGA